MKEEKHIRLPDKYPLTEELVKEFQLLNAGLAVNKSDDNTLVVSFVSDAKTGVLNAKTGNYSSDKTGIMPIGY